MPTPKPSASEYSERRRGVYLVALTANLGLLFATRPFSTALGWGHDSAFANLVEIAPLTVLCLAAAIGPGRVSRRAGGLAAGLIATATISAIHATQGGLVWPSRWLLEQQAAELTLVFVPACFFIAAAAAYGRFRWGPAGLGAQRMTIAGILLATAGIGGTLIWNPTLEKRDAVPEGAFAAHQQLEHRNHEQGGEHLLLMGVVWPVVAGCVFLGAWAGRTSILCSLVVAVAVAILGANLLTVALFGWNARLALFCAGAALVLAWIAINVRWLSRAGWILSRK